MALVLQFFGKRPTEKDVDQIFLWLRDMTLGYEFYPLKCTFVTIGPFIRGKMRRVLHKTRTVPFIRACLI